MVAPRICNCLQPDLIDSLGIAICPDAMSRGAHRGRRFSELTLAPVQEVLFPSACANCEDSDLGLRGRIAGWGALLARDAVVYHKYSMTSARVASLSGV